LSIAVLAAEARIIYVDMSATGQSNGSNWADAHLSLHDALAAAQYGDKIRVAKGVYKPDQRVVTGRFGKQIVSSGLRTETFQLKDGVALKGGYAGFGQPDPNARDSEMYRTTLSGDLGGNDVDVNTPYNLLTEPTRAENSYHVVTGSGTDSTAIVDGFIIAGSNANGLSPHDSGGGMLIESGNPVVMNCTFRENSAGSCGGGILCFGCSPTITNNTISRNYAGVGGGGIATGYCSSIIANNTITENVAEGNKGGGGIYCGDSSPMTIMNNIISGNSACRGGGIYSGGDSLTLKNCTFSGNLTLQGGALEYHSSILKPPSILSNCILWDDGYEIYYEDSSTITINYTDVKGGQFSIYDPYNAVVWGEGNVNVNPLFADPNIGDCHLKSQAGRWDPKGQTWVKDEVTSPCIDAGDPMSPIGHEPFPNGGRINMGAYGGTAEASKSYFGKPVCETIVAGDINGDCKVDFADLAIMSMHWACAYTPDAPSSPPSIQVFSPLLQVGVYHPNEPIPIRLIGSDSDGWIVKVEVFVDGSEVGVDIGKVGQDTDGSDGWEVSWLWWGDWGHYPEGWYTIWAKATDDSGATGTSEKVRVYVHGPK
jgi:parallel beta-helix repeat protein